MKAETERSALDVKLKHARNQVDVEIKRRQRAEADCEKLVCIVFMLALTVGVPSFFFIKELEAVCP